MKRTYVIAGVTALSLIATSGAALALGKDRGDRGARGPQINFEQADTNKDGKLSREEMDAYAKARFDAADTNGDGKLSPEEMVAAAQKRDEERAQQRRAKMAERMLDRLDADGDGALSYEEMPGQQSQSDRMFSRLDADDDGAISAEEMEKARERMEDRRGKKGRDGHGRKHGEHRRYND